MARASANCTSEARARWLRRMHDPDYQPPRYTQEQPKKAPGSLELVLGKWVEVKDDDAC
jgi:hypothetical protein